MCYACIADIHGNLPAIKAVLADAKQQGVDEYILLGDYCIGMGAPNEVSDILRSLPGYAINGNEEAGVTRVYPVDAPTDGQFGAPVWISRHLNGENRRWLSALPAELTITHSGLPPIYAFHDPCCKFGKTSPVAISPQLYAMLADKGAITTKTFPAYAARMLEQDGQLQALLASLPNGVYLFGHKHIQWQHKIGGKLLVVPGSAGCPLDFDSRAAYTILENKNGAWHATPRRADYDREAMLLALRETQYYRDIPVWAGILSREACTAREQAIAFLQFADTYAASIGDTRRPFAADTWHAAYSGYIEENLSRQWENPPGSL